MNTSLGLRAFFDQGLIPLQKGIQALLDFDFVGALMKEFLAAKAQGWPCDGILHYALFFLGQDQKSLCQKNDSK